MKFLFLIYPYDETFEDGKIKGIELSNGVKDGFRRKWHRGGIQSVEGTMKDDKWHGSYKEWYSWYAKAERPIFGETAWRMVLLR